MNKGATIQFTTILNEIWIQRDLALNVWCSVSYRTLHRIGNIITNNPTATEQLDHECHLTRGSTQGERIYQ